MSEKFMAEIKGFGQIEIYEGETLESVYKRTVKEKGYDAVAAKCGNEIVKLIDSAYGKEKIEFIDACNAEGRRIYAASLSHMMVKAANDVIGKNCRIIIEHAINDNLYCEFKEKDIIVSDELLEKIEARMKEMAEEDILFVRERIVKDKAALIYRQQNLDEKADALKFLRYHDVIMYSLDGYYDYYYSPVVPSAGYIKNFALARYQGGFLLQMPSPKNKCELQPYENYEKISDVFIEQLKWCSLMHVNNVAELNSCIANGGFEELVRINEALHEKKIAYIADMIADKKDNVKLVLIAGPSSSGKTTFAQRLCVQLRVNGITPHVIGMDDYFIDREFTPLDEEGKPDYESINALELELFNNHMNALIRGEKVSIPSFNFVTGKKEYKGREIQLKEGDIIICEGIHGLNDELTKAVAPENKFKIFISAITQLNIDSHNRISTSDNRLIRRMVRDSHSRGKTAEKTIEGWPSVRAGEEKNIFPFQHNADVMFNSSTIYELSVLKTHILPQLYSIDKTSEAYPTVSRLLKLLDTVLAADGQCIPNNSIVKEFVGGSVFKV